MTAVVWAPTLAAVDAELATETRTNLNEGLGIRKRLYDLGSAYDHSYSHPGVDAAKTQSAVLTAQAHADWTVEATAIHNQADRACRFIEDENGTPNPPLPFDPNSSSAIMLRLNAALDAAPNQNFAGFIAGHIGAVTAVYNKKPTVVPVAPYDQGKNWFMFVPAANPIRSVTVRELEAILQDQMVRATDWTELASY